MAGGGVGGAVMFLALVRAASSMNWGGGGSKVSGVA